MNKFLHSCKIMGIECHSWKRGGTLTLVKFVDLDVWNEFLNLLDHLMRGRKHTHMEEGRGKEGLTEDFECCSESMFQI